MSKDKNNIFPKDFWIRKRPHLEKEETKEDMIPFKWSKDVSNGKRKVILYSAKRLANDGK